MRAGGCYEAMVIEAEAAVFRAKTNVLPSGSGASQCAADSEWVSCGQR